MEGLNGARCEEVTQMSGALNEIQFCGAIQGTVQCTSMQHNTVPHYLKQYYTMQYQTEKWHDIHEN